MIPVPKGFKFAVAKAGFKRPGRFDLGLIVSEVEATAAGVFTTNRFQAAPVTVAREVAARGRGRAIVANSGQANACTGAMGVDNCRRTMDMVAEVASIPAGDILPASTGVIGNHLKLDLWRAAMDELKESLGSAEALDVAKAIMTTDTFPKLAWASITQGERQASILGMAKGAGMICPDMATMLSFVITDAAIDPVRLTRCLRRAADESFNAITIDGDTSTNDCVLVLANGQGGMSIGDDEEEAFAEGLTQACQGLAYMVVQDAEGGTKIVRIIVGGAADNSQAEQAARAVAHSPLVKTALFGQDPNWGRIVAALGRSGADFAPDEVVVKIGALTVFEGGRPVLSDVDAMLAPHMRRQDIVIDISLGRGPGSYVLLTSDLSKDYVSINADYRT